jgi:hypothetical protein
MKRLWIRDYSVDFNGTLSQRSDMEIEYNDTADPKWKMMDDRKFVLDEKAKEGRWEPVKIAPGEELNTAKLDELKAALDDLKIIDISRKPAGLSAELKAATDFTKKPEAIASLDRKGFFVAKLNGQVDVYSNEGEIRVVMKDGVQYVLRFGAIAGSGASNKDKKDESDKENGADSGLNRYLFVMVDFSPDILPKPKLEPLPEIKKDAAQKPEEKKALEAERNRIEKENKRKQEEYDRQVADGKKRVEELNARFADWYYIISDSVFRKIHLGHDEIFTKKEPAKKSEAEPPKTPAAMLKTMEKEGPGGKK